MALATYSDLRAAIARVLQRSDLVAAIPDLIALAESQMAQRLDSRLQDSVSTLSTASGVETVTLPTDILNVRSLTVTSTSPDICLDYVSPERLRTDYGYGTSGAPLVYTIAGALAYLAPVPDQVYTLSIVYQARVPALSDSATTNYVLTNYPDVYLYGALANAGPYIEDNARVTQWKQAFQQAIEGVNAVDWHSGSTMTIRADVNR
ncbi:hypothetical protein UFOVP73_54 [uncultured Caudovirales phage]|uniref:Uncharacterized protein n=1 Tax=uncultured Caudovirales phage TaxID=2100421 RepID=A0A6J7WAR9_9CAUD|nr:hypothetical protein UFOVP73_54 [uncultured Caudovirales phage]CAB5194655.1 hypothetical protein UFOVP170_14 [uncultured Caudovirales phage]